MQFFSNLAAFSFFLPFFYPAFLFAYMPLNQVLVFSLVVEFGNIIATLHTSESSQSLTLNSLSHFFTQIYTIIAFSFYDLVLLFYERNVNNKGGQ